MMKVSKFPLKYLLCKKNLNFRLSYYELSNMKVSNKNYQNTGEKRRIEGHRGENVNETMSMNISPD